ncbi:hypothetical protein DM813_19160 [Pseudomonas alkylphenolica]|uniref:Uncharacterized protein n=1 Tax=Pseudomonas alkylphenolica TaxID=237609 RepID=A0A443ZQD3_9PSED|nr:hypothetical protein [Pseudomonas alkylphenolica]RWU21308.1 hypothetical protein DM813_19160 [Pseudomonas alkylphenolica]
MYGSLSAAELGNLFLAFKVVLQYPDHAKQKCVMAKWVLELISEAFAAGRLEDLRLWTVFSRVYLLPGKYPEDLHHNVGAFLSTELAMAQGTPCQYFDLSDMFTI